MNNKKPAIIIVILIVIIVALVIVCLRTCRKNDVLANVKKNQSQTEVCEHLNSLLSNVGYPVILTTKTTEKGNVFNGNYTITEHGDVRAASYSYEKLSAFEIGDDDVVIPDDFKTTLTGQIKIKNGKIIEQNGAALNVAIEALNVKSLSLSESLLTNVKSEAGAFSADIISLNSVMNIDFATTDAKIDVAYTDTKITKIVLSYATSSYRTEMTYRFG